MFDNEKIVNLKKEVLDNLKKIFCIWILSLKILYDIVIL